MRTLVSSRTFMFFSTALLCSLAALTVAYFLRQTVTYRDEVITEHIGQLSSIFKKINATCKIVSFEHERNYIDFLTVKAFVGSEIGSMNLRYPKRWQGPYIDDNPTMQQKYYEIVRTRQGYFIVPGQGVTLSSGKVLGKDIVIDYDTDVQALVDQGVLKNKDNPLAARVVF